VSIAKAISLKLPSMKLLDIGCGGCGIADIFAERHNVDVIDSNASRVPAKWIKRFRKTTAQAVPLDDYDGVILAGVLYHLSTESQREVCRRLAGKLVILDTHYCHGSSPGMPRDSTASSEPAPIIPSLKFIDTELFPGHTLHKHPEHHPHRSWFVCQPTTNTGTQAVPR
jgi:hypothetical protein